MRFGLIGAGAIGVVRAAALKGINGAQLVGVYDLDRARAGAAAHGARYFDTVQSLIGSDDVDALVISTPPPTHHDMALMALEAGKHVLVEKPMASTTDACRSMVAAAVKANRLLAVGFNHRYFKALKLVRDTVRSGAIGRLSHVRAFAGHTGLSEFKAPWMYDGRIMGGGALMDNGIHILDLVRYVMGDFTEVFGYRSNAVWRLDETEDNALALFRSTDGVLASLQASWSEWKGYRFHIEAYGDRGMARAYYAPMASLVVTMDSPGGRPSVVREFYPADIVREKLWGWQSTVIAAFREEFTDFMAVANGQTSSGRLASGIDGLRAVEVAKAVYESGESGSTVRLAPL